MDGHQFVDGGVVPAEAGLPLNEAVFRVLKAHILGDVFKEGLVLRERAIAHAFGVGRAPAAMALRKLESDGLIRKRAGHGFLVAESAAEVEPIEISLESAGLVLPEALQDSLKHRKLKARIYPEVERAVAACLVFGRFRINKSTLAEHFGVSRTVAHEILCDLEAAGFASVGENARWYVGPLTFEAFKECYEIRWLLEPEALRQAAGRITREELLQKRAHLDRVLAEGRYAPEEMHAIEADLHSDLVLRCANRQMRRILVRCQLPVIATYETVSRDPARSGHGSGLFETLLDHRLVLDRLLDGDVEAAVTALKDHIQHALRMCTPHFRKLPPLPREKVPPYMTLE